MDALQPVILCNNYLEFELSLHTDRSRFEY